MTVPGTEFLSTFDDPPEAPLREGGNWYPPFLGALNFGSNVDYLDMQKASGRATNMPHSTVIAGIISYSYWTQAQYSGDHVEVWGVPTGGQLGAAVESWRLFMWQSLNPPIGYLGLVGGGIGKSSTIRKYENSSFSDIAVGGHSYSDALMLRTNGDDVEFWGIPFASIGHPGEYWTEDANWTLYCSVTDTSYRGPFYIGMGIEDPTNGGLFWTAFGGGIPHRTQIYRILKALS